MLGFVVLDEYGGIRLITSELPIACQVAKYLEKQGIHPRVELFSDIGKGV